MAAIYLIRHASPDWNRRDLLYHRPPGPPLTPQGEQEAADLGSYLKEKGIQLILSSPLERRRRTAEILANETGAPFSISEALIEVQPGESPGDILARVWPVFERAQEWMDQGPVALVFHGGPIAVLLLALGMPSATLKAHQVHDHGNVCPPAGVWKADRDPPAEGWKLELVYLPEAYREVQAS